MTGSITYLVDCASYQGAPDWPMVAATCGGGAEKVTEGAGYVNPRWAASKTAMAALAPHGFIPLGYMFMDAGGTGAAQAESFASAAGPLDGFGIAVDLEHAPDGNPTRQQAVDAVAELRKLYPRHPIGGYAPHWYTGGEDLTFFDWLWASEYVNGSGDPGILYSQVPAAWWAPYGGRSPLMLQFTSKASVAGVVGPVDCSAFHGTPAQLGARVLPTPPPPPPVPKPPAPAPVPQRHPLGGDRITLMPGDPPVFIPVWASASAYKEPAAYSSCSLTVTGGSGAVVRAALHGGAPHPDVFTVPVASGQAHPVVPPSPWPAYSVIELQRLDTKQGVSAAATFRTW